MFVCVCDLCLRVNFVCVMLCVGEIFCCEVFGLVCGDDVMLMMVCDDDGVGGVDVCDV